MKRNGNNTENLQYGIIGFLIGGILVWLLSISFVNSNNIGMMRMMGIRGAGQYGMLGSGNMDAHFIEQMIPHHEDAITMSNLALQKAQRSEVKTLAQNIIDSQTGEINLMKTWYKDWFGRQLPSGYEIMRTHGMMNGSTMHMGMMGDETDLERLQSSPDFDKVFLEEMIPHHQMAVMMASMLKGSTQRPEMSQLADDIITLQSDEIDQMRLWLKDWN